MADGNLIDLSKKLEDKGNKERLRKIKTIMDKMEQLASQGTAIHLFQPSDEERPPLIVNLDQVLAGYKRFDICRQIQWKQKWDGVQIHGEEQFWLPNK